MLKWQLAEKMQQIDQQLAETKRQVKADTFMLEASHELFDDILEESLIQIAMLKGESVDKKKDTPVVLQARLMSSDETDDEDW